MAHPPTTSKLHAASSRLVTQGVRGCIASRLSYVFALPGAQTGRRAHIKGVLPVNAITHAPPCPVVLCRCILQLASRLWSGTRCPALWMLAD